MFGIEEILTRSNLILRDSKILFPDWCKRVKIDIGLSHNAPQSFEWIKQDSELIVLGFEPVNKNIQSVRKKIVDKFDVSNLPNKDLQIFVVPVALGDNSTIEKVNMYVTALDAGCSSLLPPKDFEVMCRQETLVLKLSLILDHFPFEKIPFIDHLKIDAQGFDFNILKGVEKYINKIFAITLEAEDKQYLHSNNNLRSIDKFLKINGFVPIEETWRLKLPFLAYTEDPTYINVEAYSFSRRRDLYLYQSG